MSHACGCATICVYHGELVPKSHLATLTAENERLRASQDVLAEAHEAACRRAEQAEARVRALEADLAFLGATRMEDGLRLDMRKYHAAHGTDPARVAALEEALQRISSHSSRDCDCSVIASVARAALARPTPTPQGTSHVCSYDFLVDGSIGCSRCTGIAEHVPEPPALGGGEKG